MIPAIDVYKGQFVAKTPSAHHERRLNTGGRVLLPPYVLQEISNLSMAYPLQFKLSTCASRVVYAGVLEFSAESGTIVLPAWMMECLKLREGGLIRLETCNLDGGYLVQLRPHERAFVEITDPRRVLESRLSDYPILTRGTTITINYIDRAFHFDVVEVTDVQGKGTDAVLTARADARAAELKVEFERPLDMPPPPVSEEAGSSDPLAASQEDALQYTVPKFSPPTISSGGSSAPLPAHEEHPQPSPFVPFTGAGRSLCGAEAAPPRASVSEEERRRIAELRMRAFQGTGARSS